MTEPTAPCGGAPPALIVMAVGGPVTLSTVDVLARLQLAARRVGLALQLADDEPELRELLRLTGLDSVVRSTQGNVARCALVVELGRQAEPREEPGVEEVMDVGDPPA